MAVVSAGGYQAPDKKKRTTTSPKKSTNEATPNGMTGAYSNYYSQQSQQPATAPKVQSAPSAPIGGGSSSGGGSGGSSAPKPVANNENEDTFREKYSKQIQNEIDTYRQQMDQNLQRFNEQTQSTVGRNNQYLEQQLAQLQEQRNVSQQDAINLQNRRGGFYSGGTDYRLAQVDRGYADATGQVQSEIGSRNAELEQSYNTAAQQAMDQISLLQKQAPQQVQQLVDAALERQYQREVQERQLAMEQQRIQQSAANASAARELQRQQMQQAQAQQEWENQFKEQQWNWETSQAGGGEQSSGLSQREMEVFASQFTGDLNNSSPDDIRTFVNNQYASGTLYDENEADQLESYLNSFKTPTSVKQNYGQARPTQERPPFSFSTIW